MKEGMFQIEEMEDLVGKPRILIHCHEESDIIRIPDGVNMIAVGAVSKSVVRLEIPKSVRLVEPGLFRGYKQLKEVVVFSETIGREAFEGCVSLDEVSIENGVREIKPRAFANTKVKEVFIPNGCSIADDSFPDGCRIVRVMMTRAFGMM